MAEYIRLFPKRPRKRDGTLQTKAIKKRYTLRALLVVITITCSVLALYYPRAKYVVSVKVPDGPPPGPAISLPPINAATYHQLMGASVIVERVTENFPAAAAYLKDVPDKGQYLKSFIKVAPIDHETLRFEASGRPTERRKIKILVDAVVETIVTFHEESHANICAETRALIERAAVELDREIDELGGQKRERTIQLRQAVQDRLDEINAINDSNEPAEVIDRETGVSF